MIQNRIWIDIAAVAAEGSAGVEIGAAGALESAADFGETERDGQREEADQHEADRAPGADLRSHLRRPHEDGAADHLVHADRSEIPFAKSAT